MLLKGDAAQLEWRVKVYLAQDKVGIKEILNKEDLHSDNQKTFGLPSRLIAKIFIYRMIFADAFGEQGFEGPAFAYANDSDFMQTSSSVKFWTNVITKFFEKYPGIYNHSVSLIREAAETGRIVSPSGRVYPYTPVRGANGPKWPHTQILNYIVQGFSADIMIVVRYLVKTRLPEFGYGKRALLINTVHDDIELDVDNDPIIVYNISKLLEQCFQDSTAEFKKKFGVEINVPMAGEVKMGWSLYEKDMVKFNDQTFEKSWETLQGKEILNAS